MRKVSKTAKKVLETLTDGVNAENPYRKIDKGTPGFIAVSVDFLRETPDGTFFAIAHNSVQNGDLMADPDMSFLRSSIDGEWYPVHYQNDYTGTYQEAVIFNESGRISGFRPRLQKDLAVFVTSWMRNVKLQQGL